MPAFDPVPSVAAQLGLPVRGVAAVVLLLAEGSTVPFIARYRKEATHGLDEVAIRSIEERRAYLLELEERRRSVLAEIGNQGKLTPRLKAEIERATSKAEVEDLYLPFRPKRRTRAIMAKERGLEPLADLISSQSHTGVPAIEAARFVCPENDVADVDAALAGARDICAERVAEHAEVRKLLRAAHFKSASIQVRKSRKHKDLVSKFDMYEEFEEPIAKIPSHRFLAIRRGETEGVLESKLVLDTEQLLPRIERYAGLDRSSPWAKNLALSIADALKRLLLPAVQLEVRVELKLRSDTAAITVFAQNLRELLLGAPFGAQRVIGIDPGQRTGCKIAVVDETGKILEHTVINLVQGDAAVERARDTLRTLCRRHVPRAIAVGNGTHGRETEAFVRELLSAEGLSEHGAFCVSVSEAGASIYSASDIAREEFPDLDLTVRGAISIARRLQDPLAELVKVDPKSIGVGQYQHDVNQPALARKLDEVVESCVNQVGVEVNTASAPLLSHVAGIGPGLAKKVVAFRDKNGAFKSRKGLLKVPSLGPRAFQQSAGFLRIQDTSAGHPLDSSAVHPERYGLVERMARDLGIDVAALVGNHEALSKVDSRRYLDDEVGEYTLRDILAELQKPGRDPRAGFEPPKFRDDVQTLEDLESGMELEGVVTNVTAFGAFVDVGVHQDGLVHVSQLADRFVKDPSEVVKVGHRLNVRVLDVDLARRRISLSAKKNGAVGGGTRGRQASGGEGPRASGTDANQPRSGKRGAEQKPQRAKSSFGNNPFADRLKR